MGIKWTRERILSSIAASAIDGCASSKNMTLTVTARRMFGTWSAACRAAGVVSFGDRPQAKSCKIDDCNEPVRSRFCDYCELHYYRHRRTGSFTKKICRYRYTTAAGYIILKQPGHALADSRQCVFEHRFVAYEMHNGVCPPCGWCGIHLEWPAAVVDHLDENKENNDLSNLMVACNQCNRARGAMLPFIRGMDEKAFWRLVSLMKHQVGAARDDGSRLALGPPQLQLFA